VSISRGEFTGCPMLEEGNRTMLPSSSPKSSDTCATTSSQGLVFVCEDLDSTGGDAKVLGYYGRVDKISEI
jgi:phenylpropionate dioxygenase-like ring-hydroxylating dioxygenase large terminal subunit